MLSGAKIRYARTNAPVRRRGVVRPEPAADKKELERQICEHMNGVKANPKKVSSFFQKRSVKYAAD